MANLSKIKRKKMLDYLEKLKEINNDDEKHSCYYRDRKCT